MFDQELQLVNQARASGYDCGSTGKFGPAAPLTRDSRLDAAAQAHTVDMVTNNYFDHTGSDGSDPGQRMVAAGYKWHAYGENIAEGYTSAAAVVQGWLQSPGHCANIMDPEFVNVGFGEAATAKGVMYWTQDFGTP